MRRFALIAAGLASLTGGAQAADRNAATLRIAVHVPVSCTIELQSIAVTGRQAVARVHRRCNAAHSVTVSAADTAALGEVRLAMGGTAARLAGSYTVLPQRDRVYDGYDTITIRASRGDRADLIAYVASLRIGIDLI